MLLDYDDDVSNMTGEDLPPTYEQIMASNVCMCVGEISEQEYSSTYSVYNFVVVIVLLPLVATFGFFSNIVNMLVFSRPRMLASSSVYLIALAGSDLLVVVTGLFIFWLDSVREYLPQLTYFATNSTIWVLPIGYMAQTGSVYFTVGAAIDCYINVCWDPIKNCYCTVTKAKIFVSVVLVFTICYNTLRFWQFFLHDCFQHGEFTVEICATETYAKVNLVYNVYMYMVLMTFLPFILLSILNALIVRNMKYKKLYKEKNAAAVVSMTNGHHFAHRYQLCPMTDSSGLLNSMPPSRSPSTTPSPVPPSMMDDAGGNSGDDTVITMVMVVILFLTCNILALIINIVETFFDPDTLLLNYLTDTSNFLVVFNSSVNFVIYFLFDGQYRKVLVARVRPSYRNDVHLRLEIRTESTLQTLLCNEGAETTV